LPAASATGVTYRFAMSWIVAAVLLVVIAGCGGPPPSRCAIAARTDVHASNLDARSDPTVRDCEAKVEECSGIAVRDPERSWQAGLRRLAAARAELCAAGDRDGCYRAWQYGLRDDGLLRRGCELGSQHACITMAAALHESAPAEALPFAIRACELENGAGCVMAADIVRGGLGVAVDEARAAELDAACAALAVCPRRPGPTVASGGLDGASPAAIEARRIAGDKVILPPSIVKFEMVQAGQRKLVASVKLCLDSTGLPSAVTMLKSSGYRAYDHLLRRTIEDWRYRPFEIDGKPVPVCTAVTFIYAQKPAVPASRPVAASRSGAASR
jgi:hypothetical protein